MTRLFRSLAAVAVLSMGGSAFAAPLEGEVAAPVEVPVEVDPTASADSAQPTNAAEVAPTAEPAQPSKVKPAQPARPVKPAEKGPEPQVLELKGAADAYYYAPTTKGLKPVLMVLHGRGGHPKEDCKKWARVARDFGWVVCPQGPEDRGGGARSWANNPEMARQILDTAVTTLRAKYKGRVQTRNNILIGFSEGAFIAQQVGLKDSQKWSRWLILAASDRYWMGETKKDLETARQKLHRVYLLTGENDGVAKQTTRAGDLLRTAKVPVRVNIVKGMGHEVPSDKMITNYRRPLLWLTAK